MFITVLYMVIKKVKRAWCPDTVKALNEMPCVMTQPQK